MLGLGMGLGKNPVKRKIRKNIFDYKQVPNSLTTNTTATLITDGIKVKNSIAGYYCNAKYRINVAANKTYYFKANANVISGTTRVDVTTVGGATLKINNTAPHDFSFASGSNTTVDILFYCTIGSSVSGEVDYTNIMLSLENIPYETY